MSDLTPFKTTLDHLMPMHLVFNGTGHIQHAGPTLRKLHPDLTFAGARVFEVFEVIRPRNVTKTQDMFHAIGMKLHLRLRGYSKTEFKAVVAPGESGEGGVLNLSFGIGVVDAIERFNLSNADFAPNDLVVEMLYLLEAKSAAMEESKNLNDRLHSARLVAEEKAFSDPLTGLRNRRALDHVMQVFFDNDVSFTLMQIDLDFFKAVNDTYGHGAGDAVLKRVADVLKNETRSDDILARTGGDEFVVVFRKCMPDDKLEEVANRIIAQLEVPVEHDGNTCRISASIGTVQSEQYPTPDAAQMMADSDLALYASKNAGRGRHTAFCADTHVQMRQEHG